MGTQTLGLPWGGNGIDKSSTPSVSLLDMEGLKFAEFAQDAFRSPDGKSFYSLPGFDGLCCNENKVSV